VASFLRYSLSVSIVQNQHTSSVVAMIARVGDVSFSSLRTLPNLMSYWGIAGREPGARGLI